MNYDTHGHAAPGRVYTCRKCNKPIQECDCEEWEFKHLFVGKKVINKKRL